ncbi:unnamed protein product [Bursaphelenchus xylophilus]|uniref:(pine wood nematode) hypothetical protein n=1 Tax=Bursaphelenchus xylophilus TaxID=6326 RepID=A0A1I7RHA6_BURXY|nr:unnamed protein product [Bursaphelenchus xylophilus]CAG9115892.1 unnamed protein product [Bursaphelenchus xylophilus]
MDYLMTILFIAWLNFVILAVVICAKTKYPEQVAPSTRKSRPTVAENPPLAGRQKPEEKVIVESSSSENKNDYKKPEAEKKVHGQPQSDPAPLTLNGLMPPGECPKFDGQKEKENRSDPETDFRSLEDRLQKEQGKKAGSLNKKMGSAKRAPTSLDGTVQTQYGSTKRQPALKTADLKESGRFDSKRNASMEVADQTQATNYHRPDSNQASSDYIAPVQNISTPTPPSRYSDT